MANILKFFGVDRVMLLYETVKQYGGVKACLYKMYITDSLKPGKLMGTDEFGNTYYENPSYFFGRDRWVVYVPHFALEYDASQVPAEWYGWLHHKTDLLPHCDPSRPKYKWMAQHIENLSGTPGQYVPYSTTRPKIQAWVPPSNKNILKCP
ncbi:probable NADH dehydrogenase [ubiquinone] 1 alpha subcomplex subunit 12 [Cylas formicarius]|uniref:probable NADH dehydrogenase [ubiquinone] 1 alpha subcomplex subunit 12 n=1 Tax=Cylas formicarius TaxID=197179 RepID=UPI00295835E3|nr:probable NADH dehydrogenase [ubiquinone] 1 alpha subcomplex subunit 12 [Cylas formicarius]